MTTPLILAMIAVVAMCSQAIAWFTRLPAILFLLIAGMLLGPGLGVLNPDQVFGDLLFPLISLSVAIILFEGSLTLHFDELRKLGRVVHRLVTVGALVSWIVVSIAVYILFPVGWGISILLGAITVVTGPTVIMPMLRTVRPSAKVSSVLRWEGIVIDPIGALLAVVVFEFLATASAHDGQAFTHSLWLFFSVLFWGFLLGGLGGYILGLILRKRLLPEFLLNLTTLTFVFAAFTGANAMAHESGLLAVTVMGMWLANMRGVQIEDILNFKENLTIVLISGLFIILAARIDTQQLLSLGLPVFLLLIVLQFVARPLSVMASTYRSNLSMRERLLLCWIAPRGIVAAAVSAIFALRLEEAGAPYADYLVPITFSVIIGTVLLQSLTARTIALWLGVAESAPKGYLIVGANSFARMLGKTLRDAGFRVVLSDSSWDNISAARMAGLETFYGNPVSEYADRRLELAGVGQVLCLSPQRELNTVAAMRYQSEFGSDAIYALRNSSELLGSEKHQVSIERRGHALFGEGTTYGKLAGLLSRGAEIRQTRITKEFSFEDYRQQGAGQVIPLFAINEKGKVSWFMDGSELNPGAGSTVYGLVSAERLAEKAAAKSAEPKLTEAKLTESKLTESKLTKAKLSEPKPT